MLKITKIIFIVCQMLQKQAKYAAKISPNLGHIGRRGCQDGNWSHFPPNFFLGGRANIGVSSGWRVCHPLGTPCLVLIRTTIVVYCNSIDSVENLKRAKYFKFSKISNFYIFEIRTFIIHTFAITPFFELCPATVGLQKMYAVEPTA